MVAAEHVYCVVFENAAAGLRPLLVQLVLQRLPTRWNRGVEPLIKLHVVVLAADELYFEVAIIASECVDLSFMVDSGEEGLLMGHVGPDLDRLRIVVQVVVGVAIASKKIDALLQGDEDLREV